MTGSQAGNATARSADRVLVYERMDPTNESVDWLAARGLDLTVTERVMWQPQYSRYSEDEFIALASGYCAVLGGGSAPYTRRVLESLPDLQFIAKFGIGFDNVDIGAASERGILVANTPEDLDIVAVAEHTIGVILALKKNLLLWTTEAMRAGRWRGNDFATYLSDATVGIVGLGRIGRAVAQRLQGWNMRVVAHDPYVATAPTGVSLVDLPRLLGISDIVTLHAEATPATRHIIDGWALSRMKPTSILVNMGRGSLVDYDALRSALREGSIAGAGLDVYDPEPPDPDDELFRMPNVIATPHAAAWTFECVENLGWRAARNLWAMMSGVGPADCVNPQARSNRLARDDGAGQLSAPAGTIDGI